jgi:hypothetical protein
VAAGAPERRGVADALRDLGPALRARRVVPDAVLADLDLLAAPGPVRTAPPVPTPAGDAP